MLRVAAIDAGDFVKDYFYHRARLDGVMVSHAVDSIEGLLSQRAGVVDAAVIHSGIEAYGAAIRTAAQYKKHVLVYGQIGLAPRRIKECVRACEEAGVVLYVARPLRTAPYQQAVYASLASGELGELGLVRIHSWKQRVPTEMSPLFLVVNEVDVACWLFNDWPETVFAVPISGKANNLQIHLGFPGGGMAMIDCNDGAPSDNATYFSLSAIGSKGAAYADDHRNVNLVTNEQELNAVATSQGNDYVWQHLNAFASSIAAGATDDGSQCLRAVTVAKAAYSSIKNKAALRREGDGYVC